MTLYINIDINIITKPKYLDADNTASSRSWKEVDPLTDIEPAQLSFTEGVGAQLPSMSTQTPANFFHLFFSNPVIDLICEETNR